MLKIIILFLLLSFLSFFIFKDQLLTFINKDYEIINIRDSNGQYKTKPDDLEGITFEGESLEIYQITREKLLPQIEDKNRHNEINDRDLNNKNLYIQVAAYKNYESAEENLNKLKNTYENSLNDLKLFISKVNIDDKGIFYRLRVGPIKNMTEVYELCDALEINKSDCVILRGLKD